MVKKKIVLIGNTTWYLFNFRQSLIKELQKNYKIIIIAPKDEYSNKLDSLGCKYHDIEIDNRGSNPMKDLKLMYSFYKFFKKLKPDIILSFTIKPNIYGGIVSRILNIPTISTVTGLGTVFLHDNISSKIAQWLYKISFKGREIVFQNLDDYKIFLKKCLINENQGIHIPGSGIDMQIFKSKSKVRNKNMVFLLIARLIRDKGIMEYIEAIRFISSEYPNVQFKILGSYYDGNPTAIPQSDVESWVAEGLIEYLGFTDEVSREIEKVDCIVLPSYREGLSRVLLEAASMSKPIITTDVPGCREIVDDGINGYLAKVRDSKSLAEAIKKIIVLSYNKRKEMGEKSREKVKKNFSDEIVIKKYLNVISSMQ